MTEPIRILHFADLHIGMENYGRLDAATGLNRRVVDFLERLDMVVDYAISHEADLVLFAGDAFRTRSPNPTHQREFAQRIRRLSEAAIPTVLLVGNHDVPVMMGRASSIEIFDTLDVPYVTVASRPDLLRIDTKRGTVQVATLPYMVRQRLLTREHIRRMTPEELDQEVTERMVGLIRDHVMHLDTNLPAILLGHFTVDNSKAGSERQVMVGREVFVQISELNDPVWDYVALGHVHRHQNLNLENNPPIIYSGSLERVDFGEEKQPKGFCWVEVQRGETTWRYIEVPARPFVTIRVDVREVESPLDAIQEVVAKHKLDGAVVRLVVEMSPKQEPRLRDADLSPLLADAFFAQINRDVDRAVRDRLEGLEPDAMTPAHLLERYLRSKGKTDGEIKPYIEEAQSIFAETAET